ncbi:stage V sporulation protein AA [Pueribacillus sp. YX66]|uniref:stage V sporulation protein AA n=1 Tax=Pueribacillus sp. YX66 TaxID=3229242 RepID=UPI00358CEC5B
MDTPTIYVKMKHQLEVNLSDKISIQDTTFLAGNKEICEKLGPLIVHEVKEKDHNVIIIDLLHVIDTIYEYDPIIEIESVGLTQTVVRVREQKKNRSFILFIFVWLLLFFGSGLAIMYFHEDVSMREVHQHIYFMVTGNKIEFPLLLQIPYSIGLGVGMILFFNHLFKKKLNEEPSPLDIEMFNYEQDLDQYLIVHENKSERNE